jgi:hypothetical protein
MGFPRFNVELKLLVDFPLPPQQVVADIIWEADEDCDGKNTYEEFCKMYQRCQNDTAGTPLYNSQAY